MLTSCEYINHKEWLCKDAIGEFTVKGYTDKHSLNFTQKFNIAEIKLRDQNVNRFPRGFGSFFPRLKRLNIIHCGLSTISRDDLIGLEELEHLAIIFNPLTSLPSDLFIGMTQLKSISFKDNKVKTMSSKLLDQILKNGPITDQLRLIFEEISRLMRFTVPKLITTASHWKNLWILSTRTATNQLMNRLKYQQLNLSKTNSPLASLISGNQGNIPTSPSLAMIRKSFGFTRTS